MSETLALEQGLTQTREDTLATHIRLDRHDRHNLEVKLQWDFGNVDRDLELDWYFFIPESLRAAQFSGQDLDVDLLSRVKFSGTQHPRQGSRRSSQLALSLKLAQGEVEASEVGPCIREYANHLFDFLKEQARTQLKLITFSQALFRKEVSNEGDMGELRTQIRGVYQEIRRAHHLILRIQEVDPEFARNFADYLHHGFSDYLGQVRGRLLKQDNPSTSVLTALELYQQGQAQFMARMGIRLALDTHREQEEYLLRMSQLKKFFQAPSFVEVSSKETIKRFSEPIASSAAACAAVFAAGVQVMAQDSSGVQLGTGGIIVLAMGVFFYVLRDRLKDRGKTFLNKWLRRRLPDREELLMSQGKRLGRISKWRSVHGFKKWSSKGGLRKLRKKLPHVVEGSNREDLFHIRRRIQLGAQDHSMAPTVQEMTRINLRRYLKYMDDTHKDLQFVDAQGQLQTLKTKKIYPIYVMMEERGQGEPHRQGFEVILNKKGIQRVQAVTLD